MPEYTVESYESHDYLETSFSNASGRVSQYQWMSRYTQGSNDSIPPRCKECIHLDAINKDTNIRGRYVHNAGNTKSRMAKMLPQGLSHQSTSEYKNVIRSGLNGVDLTIYSRQKKLTESLESENGFTDNSKKQKDAFLQEHHFPTFSISHNSAGALNPKNMTVYGQNSSRLSESRQSHGTMAFASSHALEFVAEDNHFEGQKMTSSALDGNKFVNAKNLHTCENNVADSTSLPVNEKIKSQVPNNTLSEFPEEKSVPSSTVDVHTRNTAEEGPRNFKHELRNIWGSSSFITSRMEDNIISSNSKMSWSQKNSRSIRTLGGSCVGGYTLSPLVGDDDKCILNYSMSRMLPHGHRFCNSVNDYCQGTQPVNNITNCSINNLDAFRMTSSLNSVENKSGNSQDISNSFQYWLSTEVMSKELPHREQLHARLIDSGKAKTTTALYEMLTVPTTSDRHSKQNEDFQCYSSSYGYGDYDNWNDTHTGETNSRSSLKTSMMSMNVCQNRISPKGIDYTIKKKDKFTRRDLENEILNTDLHYPNSCETHFIRHKEATGPKADSMDADWNFSNSQVANESNSGSVRECLSQVKPCSRWLKRLGHSPSSPLLSTKRSRIGNDPSCDIALSKTMNCNMTSSLENVTEQRTVNKNLHCDAEKLTDVSERELQAWIGRWSHKGTQQPSPEQCSPEYSELKSSEEKQFPSIAAMALMAKVMNKSQRYQFQKRGSSTVWKTECL